MVSGIFSEIFEDILSPFALDTSPGPIFAVGLVKSDHFVEVYNFETVFYELRFPVKHF